MLTDCTTGTVASWDNRQSASIRTIEPVSSPTPTLYPEPSVTPTALPSSVKWDPYRGVWYDSSQVQLDPVTHLYKGVPLTVPPDYIPPKVASITIEEWITQHQNSTDEIEIAIVKYWRALSQDIERQKVEDPNWMLHSWIPIGAEKGGPLTILTDLGIPELQRLVDRVQWENPLVYYLEAAVDRITRRTLTLGGGRGGDIQTNIWKKDFNDQASGAKSRVVELAQDIANNKVDNNSIQVTIGKLGIFALPEVYELVINQGNTDLIKYLPDILPLDKMQTYDIKSGVTDDSVLKQALLSCSDDIRIIQTLKAN